ncbi:unnamed protein product [Malus baccata var. baccata]
MTRSSQLVLKHIFDFDVDFEQTLRRARNQQDPQPSQPAPDLEKDKVEEQEEATARTFEEVQNMAVDNRTIKELSASGLDNALLLCIQYPRAAQNKTDEFELKSSLLHHIPKFHGLSMENPNKHLKEFEVVCSSMTPVNVDGSILKMKAFPFSLLEKAKDWLYKLAPGTVTSWESMKQAFLEKFFPTSRVILLRKRISGIQQNQGVGQRDNPQQQQVNELLTTLAKGQENQAKDMHNYAKEVQNQAREVTELKRQMGQMAEFIGFMQSKKDESDKDIIDTFRKVQVNIPLLDAIKQVPKYVKFLNELCITRKRVSNKEVVRVRNTRFESAMLDLDASINVMPYSIYASMNLGELKNDGVIIQLADRSNAYPKGVLEDVLVQVNHLVFPADFYVLEMEDLNHSPQLPILLGRPFMKTARTKIDVFKGTLTMEFDEEVIDFNISDAMRYPHDGHSCFSIDVIDSWAQEFLDDLSEDALEKTLTQSIGLKNEGLALRHSHGNNKELLAVPIQEELIDMVAALESNPRHIGKSPNLISIPNSTNKLLPSVIQPPSLELKPLPSHLKYVFLGEQETLPVIISSSLTAQEEDKLVRVLREYKTTIGWTLADIKGISYTTCMHRILLEE